MPMKKSGLFRNKNAKATPYKNKGVTEVGKEAKTQSYKEYVQKMFGGGMSGNRGSSMSQPDSITRYESWSKEMYRGGTVAVITTNAFKTN
jgi:hypothetical protein